MSHEIMENDNMFSVLVTPWHGLGIVLDSPPTIEEGLQKANLNWSVKLTPLFYKAPKIDFFGEILHYDIEVSDRAVIREDTNEILGTVGSHYQPLQNKDAFSIFEPLVNDGSLSLETAGSLKNGRRVWILGKINIDSADIGKGDEVKPYVLLSNSHDGTLAVRFGFTPIRVVCNNTLSAAESGNTSQLIRLLHTSNIQSNLSALRDLLNLSKASFTSSIEQYKFLASKDINQFDLERYVKLVFDPDFERTMQRAQEQNEAIEMNLSRTQESILSIFESGLGSKTATSKTWWGAYNSINEWLMYYKGRNADNRLNSVWFGDGYNFNQRALNTAMKLAA